MKDQRIVWWGYTVQGDKVMEQGFEFLQGTPAGGISTTARDMAYFLMAHLNQGSLYGNIILKPETVLKSLIF